MQASGSLAAIGLALLLCASAGPSFGAGPEAAPGAGAQASQTAQASPATIAVAGAPGAPAALTEADIATLPTTQVAVSFGTEHGPRQATFEGPLLWALLDHAGAIDAGKPGGQVRQTIQITGRDGYKAILALGEIAPEFENKQVILAERMDGRPLGLEHFRIVVPGDKRGGRGVRDVASITVTAP